MNDPKDSMTDPTLSGHPVPFNKPRTMPGGWDLSSQPSRLSAHSQQPDSIDWDRSDEEIASSENDQGQAQKFTQPRTIPKGWDTSVLK